MAAGRTWWWIPLVAVVGISLKALLLTPWVAGAAEDAAVAALRAEGLGSVRFVEVDGVHGLGGEGLDVVLEGPAVDEAAAIAAVEATEEVRRVTYRRAVVPDRAGDDESGSPPVDLVAPIQPPPTDTVPREEARE